MKDSPLRKCPKCKKLGLKRLLGGGAGLIFKGSGFYITDYKQKSGSPAAGKSGAETSTSDKSSSSAKAESKSAAK